MAYNVGETVICSITVKDSDGNLSDPATSMNIQIQGPGGVAVSSTAMTKDSTGTYHYDFNTSGQGAGDYTITYTATDGTRVSIQTDTFHLDP